MSVSNSGVKQSGSWGGCASFLGHTDPGRAVERRTRNPVSHRTESRHVAVEGQLSPTEGLRRGPPERASHAPTARCIDALSSGFRTAAHGSGVHRKMRTRGGGEPLWSTCDPQKEIFVPGWFEGQFPPQSDLALGERGGVLTLAKVVTVLGENMWKGPFRSSHKGRSRGHSTSPSATAGSRPRCAESPGPEHVHFTGRGTSRCTWIWKTTKLKAQT